METLVVVYNGRELKYLINTESKAADEVCHKVLDAYPDCDFWFE